MRAWHRDSALGTRPSALPRRGPSHAKPESAAEGRGPRAEGPLVVSAHTGVGLAELTRRIQDVLAAEHAPRAAEVPLLTRERHRRAVALARAEVALFDRAWREGAVPATIAAVHLRAATAALEDLVGAIDVEDVLDRLFSSFCVGK